MIPKELENVKQRGANMGGFVYMLYSLMTDYRNDQRGLRTVVEVGVRWGTSTNAFLYGIRDRGRKDSKIQLHSFDIKDCSGVVKDETLKPYWTFKQEDSKSVDWKHGDIDVLLIDGDHSYEGCLADYEKFEPFVKEGGIILFHDPLWPHKGVTKVFWDHVKYPKSILPLSKSGMGIIYKKTGQLYDGSKIRHGHEGISKGK